MLPRGGAGPYAAAYDTPSMTVSACSLGYRDAEPPPTCRFPRTLNRAKSESAVRPSEGKQIARVPLSRPSRRAVKHRTPEALRNPHQVPGRSQGNGSLTQQRIQQGRCCSASSSASTRSRSVRVSGRQHRARCAQSLVRPRVRRPNLKSEMSNRYLAERCDLRHRGGGPMFVPEWSKADLEVACAPQVLKSVNVRTHEEVHR